MCAHTPCDTERSVALSVYNRVCVTGWIAGTHNNVILSSHEGFLQIPFFVHKIVLVKSNFCWSSQAAGHYPVDTHDTTE